MNGCLSIGPFLSIYISISIYRRQESYRHTWCNIRYITLTTCLHISRVWLYYWPSFQCTVGWAVLHGHNSTDFKRGINSTCNRKDRLCNIICFTFELYRTSRYAVQCSAYLWMLCTPHFPCNQSVKQQQQLPCRPSSYN